MHLTLQSSLVHPETLMTKADADNLQATIGQADSKMHLGQTLAFKRNLSPVKVI